MAKVHDVVAFILKNQGGMTAMKLQKLLYYCQAWSLVWDEKPLFPDEIEAWANGPVVYSVYEKHRGAFKVTATWKSGDSSRLTKDERETVVAVLKKYGDKSSQWLSDLTHLEAPWRDARGDLPPGVPSRRIITQAAMAEFYGSL